MARPLVGHRTKRGHDRRGWHPEPALIVPLDPQRPVVQTLRPENLATRSRSPERAAPSPRTPPRTARKQAAHDRPRPTPPAPPQHDPAVPKDRWTTTTQAATLAWDRSRGWGLYRNHILTASGGRSGPTSILASCDKIRPSQPRLSPISPKGHRRQMQNLNKSRAYQHHVSAMLDLHPFHTLNI